MYGRLAAFGITLQLYNTSADKGLKGIEIPNGPITLDVKLEATFKDTDGNICETSYDPLVWTYDANKTVNNIDGRTVPGISAPSAPYAAPINWSGYTLAKNGMIATGTHYQCWNGGDWLATKSGNTVTFTVSNYEINPLWFPWTDYGNASTTHTYYDPDVGIKNIGCISAGELLVVVPFGDPDSDEYLPTVNGVSDGTVIVKISDVNLRATSIGGTSLTVVEGTENQGSTKDDSVSRSIYLSLPGSYSTQIWYTNYDVPDYQTDVAKNRTWLGNGQDRINVGGKVGVMFGWYANPSGDIENALYAYDSLLKFDDEALTIAEKEISHVSSSKFETTNVYYAAKKDGTGWSSDDEMNEAQICDMVYFESLSDLESAGNVCVGIFVERRNLLEECRYSNYVYGITKTFFNVKSDLNIIGNVYQVVASHNLWTCDSEGETIYSIMDFQNGNVTWDQYTALCKLQDAPDHTYIKSQYQNGVYIAGDTGGKLYGDSLYIDGYEAKISKYTEQVEDNGTDHKKTYDLDNNQIIVDYALYPSFVIPDNVTFDSTTTMTITDTLPAGLSYIGGSSVYGGTYVEASKRGRSGTVTDGTSVDPTVTQNEDGTTTLVWTIHDVEIKEDIPVLHFKALISSSAKNNDQYENTVTIETTECTEEKSEERGNLSRYSILVSKLTDISVEKVTRQGAVDVNADMTFDLIFSNNAVSSQSAYVLMDTMPANGDVRSSHFSGSYYVKELQVILPEGCEMSDYSVYYTVDETMSNKYSIDMDKTTVEETWTKAELSSEGYASMPEDKQITAWCIIGAVPGGENISAVLTLGLNGNSSGDIYVNAASFGPTSTYAYSYVVNRVVSGIAWYDEDLNGLRETSEERASGITVTLKDSNGETVTDLNGNPCETTTDGNGFYSFVNLPANQEAVATTSSKSMNTLMANGLGDSFTIVFTNTNGNLLTTQSSGGSNDSDALAPDGSSGTDARFKSAEGAYIDGILEPAAVDIEFSPYTIANQDIGLVKTADITVTKTVPEEDDTEFSFTLDIADTSGESLTWETTYVKNNGDAVDVTITPNYAFTLKSGDSITFKNIPAGLTYTVSEAENTSYVQTGKVDGEEQDGLIYTGTLPEDGVSIDYMNEPNKVYIKKINSRTEEMVSGAVLKITNSDDSDIYENDGETLKYTWTSTNEVYEITGIAFGTYKLVEVETPDGYLTADPIPFTVGEDGSISVDGKIIEDKIVIMKDEPVFDLMVTKAVDGSMGNKYKGFSFTVTLTEDQTAYSGNIQYVKTDASGNETESELTPDENGQIVFTLQHGESVLFKDLRYGTSYEVAEDDYSSEGYATEYTGDSKTGKLTEDVQVDVKNTRNGVVPTGLRMNATFAFALAILGFIGLAYTVWVPGKRKP